MSRWLILDKGGNRLGDFARPQQMNQAAYQGCVQVEVADSDPRVWPQMKPPQAQARKP